MGNRFSASSCSSNKALIAQLILVALLSGCSSAITRRGISFTCRHSDHLGTGCNALTYPAGTYPGMYCQTTACPTTEGDLGDAFARKLYHCLVRVFGVCPSISLKQKVVETGTQAGVGKDVRDQLRLGHPKPPSEPKPSIAEPKATAAVNNSVTLSGGGNVSENSNSSQGVEYWLPRVNSTDFEILTVLSGTNFWIWLGPVLAVTVALTVGLTLGLIRRKCKINQHSNAKLNTGNPSSSHIRVVSKAEGPLEEQPLFFNI